MLVLGGVPPGLVSFFCFLVPILVWKTVSKNNGPFMTLFGPKMNERSKKGAAAVNIKIISDFTR
jgi:hypothetical protein